MTTADLSELADNAQEASAFLRLASNENRLLILCRLHQSGEMSVAALAAAIGLSQSALSQHLAQLRDAGVVAARRQAQTIFYRVADPKAVRLLRSLKQIFCP